MDDVRVFFMQDAVTVLSVTSVVVSGVRQFTLRVDAGAREAVRVLANGIDSDFQVLGDTTLLVTPPGGLQDVLPDGIEFEVHSTHFTGRKQVRLSFELGRFSERVSGIQKLVQEVLLDMLSTAGSDPYLPRRGGSILSQLGLQTSSSTTVTDVLSSLALAAQRTEERMRASRGAGLTTQVPREELLDALDVRDAVVDPDSGRVQVSLGIRNLAGTSLTVPLTT